MKQIVRDFSLRYASFGMTEQQKEGDSSLRCASFGMTSAYRREEAGRRHNSRSKRIPLLPPPFLCAAAGVIPSEARKLEQYAALFVIPSEARKLEQTPLIIYH